MKATLISGAAALLLAAYGLYDYTRPVAATPASNAASEASAKFPEASAKTPESSAKVPEQSAKTPDDLGTLLD